MKLNSKGLLFILILNCNYFFSQSIGGTTSGSASYCDNNNSGFISLNGHIGTILFWENSINGGLNWNTISNTTPNQSYNNVAITTMFRAIVKNGTFDQDTSTTSTITIFTKANGGIISGAGNFCNIAPAGNLVMSGFVGQVTKWQSSVDNGNNWTNITHTLTNLPHPPISINTLYRSIVINDITCPSDTSSIASFSISPNSNAGLLLTNDTVCNGNNHDTIKSNVISGNIVNWISKNNLLSAWSTLSITTSSATYSNITQSTYYAIIVKSGACNADTSNIVGIIVKNANPANAGPDKTIILHETTTLDGSGDGNVVWTPNIALDNSLIINPTASPTRTTTYTMMLVDRFGCISYDSVTINVIVPIPNAITPNGDGFNDYFEIDEINIYPNNSLSIFNRWGILVYYESPYNNKWNGKNKNGEDLPDEIYYYTLDYGNGEKAINSYILIKR